MEVEENLGGYQSVVWSLTELCLIKLMTFQTPSWNCNVNPNGICELHTYLAYGKSLIPTVFGLFMNFVFVAHQTKPGFCISIVRVTSYGRHSIIKWDRRHYQPPSCALSIVILVLALVNFKTPNHSFITMRFLSWLAFFAMLLGFVSALSIPHHQRRSTELDDRLVLSVDHLNFYFSRWTQSFRKGRRTPLRRDAWLQGYGP
jgi:hypothetical protein